MAPIADVFHAPARARAHLLHFRRRVLKVDPAVRPAPVVCGVSLEERGEETMPRRGEGAQIAQTETNGLGIEVREERLRERIIGFFRKAVKLERARYDKLGLLCVEDAPPELVVDA